MSLLRVLWNYRSTLTLVLVPLLLLPVPLIFKSSEASCGYCILLMAIYWLTESLPLGVTGFLPLILFPFMGIMEDRDVSIHYLNNTNWLFIGSFTISIAVEHTHLHKRIALRFLLLFGTAPHRLMFGFMFPTYVLSMWISNTATTAMMVPVADAIIQVLIKDQSDEEKDCNDRENGYEGTAFFSNNFALEQQTEDSKIRSTPEADTSEEHFYEITTEQNENESNDEYKDLEKKKSDMAKGLTLCIPYAATIGGITTLTGTAPNLILAGKFEQTFPDADASISFGTWFIYHLPISFTLFISAYVWLVWMYLEIKLKNVCGEKKQRNVDYTIRNVLRNEYSSLGNIRWDEVTVLLIFMTTAFLWFFREPGFITGWGVIFQPDYVSDSTIAVTMAVLLFVLPSKRPAFLTSCSGNDLKPVPPILTWPTVHRMFPWSILFLIGGGFALAEGAKVSGFSKWLANQLKVLGGLENWVICLIITTVICLFTECTGNIATANLFIPVVAELASNLEIHPLYLLLPLTVAASLAFMLPISTAPNAIAFSFGRLQVVDLVKSGWILNIIGITVIMVMINTYGVYLFEVNEFPKWASVNVSTSAPTSTTLF